MKKIGLVLMLAGIFLAASMAWLSLAHGRPTPGLCPGRQGGCRQHQQRLQVGLPLRRHYRGEVRCIGARGGRTPAMVPWSFILTNSRDFRPRDELDLMFTSTDTRTGQPKAANSFAHDYITDGPFTRHSNSALRVIGNTYSLNTPIPEHWQTGYSDIVILPSARYQHVRTHARNWDNPQVIKLHFPLASHSTRSQRFPRDAQCLSRRGQAAVGDRDADGRGQGQARRSGTFPAAGPSTKRKPKQTWTLNVWRRLKKPYRYSRR